MKVCLSANARPRVGGQGVNLHHMMGALKSLGHQASVFQAGESDQWQRVPRSTIARMLDMVPLVRRKRNWIVGLDGRAFDAYVADNLPATDVFQGVTGQCARSLVSAAKRGVTPLLDSVTEHIDGLGRVMDDSCRDIGIGAPLGNGLRARMREEYRSARRIRVMSTAARDSFVRHGIEESRIFVVHPFVDLPEAVQDAPRPDGFRVSFVGLIEPWKGIQHLLDAYRIARNADTELHLWGNTGSRPMAALVGRAREADASIRIRAVDVQESGFNAVYGQSSVLVHPSLSDGFGLVVLEAMATGIPVIVSAAAGAAEIVTDGVEGFVVPPADAGAIAERLEYLRDNPGKAEGMGKAARDKASLFDLAAFCKEYERFLHGR